MTKITLTHLIKPVSDVVGSNGEDDPYTVLTSLIDEMLEVYPRKIARCGEHAGLENVIEDIYGIIDDRIPNPSSNLSISRNGLNISFIGGKELQPSNSPETIKGKFTFSLDTVIEKLTLYFDGDIRFKYSSAFLDLAKMYTVHELSKRLDGLHSPDEHPLATYFDHNECMIMLEVYRNATTEELSDYVTLDTGALIEVTFDTLDTEISEIFDNLLNSVLNHYDIAHITGSANSVHISIEKETMYEAVYRHTMDLNTLRLKNDVKQKNYAFCKCYL